MYYSRKHFDYDNCHISIDTKTGEILELYTHRNYDNLLKSQLFRVHQPFTLTAEDGRVYFPMNSHQCADRTETYVEISSRESEEGLFIAVQYTHLTDGENFFPVNMRYTVLLKGEKITFGMELENPFDSRLKEVQFPVLPGIYLGEDYVDDILVYPSWAGAKIENPIDFFMKEAQYLEWRWQDYRYGYQWNSMGNVPRLNEKGQKGFSGRYPAAGNCMPWFDLYDKEGGVYFGCHDKEVKPCILDVSNLLPVKMGNDIEKRLGLIFATAFEPYTEQKGEYATPEVVLAFHKGDWHDGAKLYRDFKQPLIKRAKKKRPSWAKDSAGLFAHYDFKYQHGGVVHTYKDIPYLAEKALKAGMKHLLFAGWHKNGFDLGYPQYYTDPDLGTEEEFIEGVKKAKEMGVHITLYMNRSLHNAAINPDAVKDKAIMYANGEYAHAYWGNTAKTDFYQMCPASKEWQDELCGFIQTATENYGVDGIYLDILSTGQKLCFNPKHNHKLDAFNEGVQEIIQRATATYAENHDDALMFLGEHISDNVGEMVAFQLNQSFFHVKRGFFPAMYRYTFPTHGIVDMIYPSKNMAFRPNFVAQASQLLMATLFTNGSYFWVYDINDDATFDRDPEGMALLKRLIAMKKTMLQQGEGYLFSDDDGISLDNDNVMVKRFIHPETGKSMLAGFRLKEGEGCVRVECKSARFIFDDGGERVIAAENGALVLPEEKMFIAFLEK